jgi:hypothetical protein
MGHRSKHSSTHSRGRLRQFVCVERLGAVDQTRCTCPCGHGPLLKCVIVFGERCSRTTQGGNDARAKNVVEYWHELGAHSHPQEGRVGVVGVFPVRESLGSARCFGYLPLQIKERPAEAAAHHRHASE